MKKLIVSLLVLILTLCLFGSAYAGSCGNAVVPGVSLRYANSHSQIIESVIELSNITDHEVEVTIHVYDHEGALLEGKTSVSTGSHTSPYLSAVTHDMGTFTIPAHGTRAIRYSEHSGTYNIIGHAKVTWSTVSDTVSKALIGKVTNMSWNQNNSLGWGTTLINNGQPF